MKGSALSEITASVAREQANSARLRDEQVPLGSDVRTAAMVAHRELLHFARARVRMLTAMITPLTFLFILGVGLNRLMSAGEDVDFAQFMLPGVIAMSVVSFALLIGVSVVVDREFGFLREMLVAPPHRVALVAGKIGGGAIVATAQGTLILLFAPLVGISLNLLTIAGVAGIGTLMALALTALGVFLGSQIRKMESFQAVLQLILLPMIFLSGAFFPLRDLPAWLSTLTHLNPLTYAVDALRQVVFSAQDVDPDAAGRFAAGLELFGYTLPIAAELGIIAGFAVLFTALSVRSFGKPE